MGAMRINLRALLGSAVVMALLWLAIEGKVTLAGIAVDNVLGWGLLGFSVWVCLVGRGNSVGGSTGRMTAGRDKRQDA